jgi:hypothetical protein
MVVKMMENEMAFNPKPSVPNSYRKAYPKVCNSPDKKDTLMVKAENMENSSHANTETELPNLLQYKEEFKNSSRICSKLGRIQNPAVKFVPHRGFDVLEGGL